jgi:hypothetical protein
MKLLHQCGHCTTWNIQALEEDGCGDGLIISPVHEPSSRVAALKNTIRKRSLFDPQYYLPNSQKAKLNSYEFFPEAITNGFNTMDFSLQALESAKLCVAFQADQGFERIVIPARFIQQMVTDYSQQQEAYAVVPFIKEIVRQKVKRPVLLTLPLTSHMVADAAYRTNLLNWVTSFPEINGVYIIVEHERSTKQVTSEIFLFDMLVMLTELKEAGLDIVIGYTNTESLLYLLAGDIDITMGAYENTRMFSLDKFIDSDEDRRGPRARIYLPGLLNWIQFGQAKQLKAGDSNLWGAAYDQTEYAEAVLKQVREPTFNQSPLYKHYFSCFDAQVEELRPLSKSERYKKLTSWIKKGISLNDDIADMPIVFERHGSGDHLQGWLDAANLYFRKYLKGASTD